MGIRHFKNPQKMNRNEGIKKIKHVLLEISKQKSEPDIVELLKHSEFIFEDHWNQHSFPNKYNLSINMTPYIFTKYYDTINKYKEILDERMNNSTPLIIGKIEILPDYNKLELINSEIIPIKTRWEEINENQNRLIENLYKSKDSIDYQNLGNTSRTIMNKLAMKVFKEDVHKPANLDMKVHNGNFKNQLHAYIEAELYGKKNKDFRKLAVSAIEFVENAIDLMNSTTHKLNAKEHFAEMSVISTISAISIVKLIDDLD